MADPTVSDVEDLDSTGWTALPDTKKQSLLDDAIREADTMYSGQYSRMPTLDGDREIFIKNLAAHKFELAEGGETNSESQTGGSTSYETTNTDDYLTLTRFGETAKRHIREEQSIGIVKSY
jgi:hypothetical protein